LYAALPGSWNANNAEELSWSLFLFGLILGTITFRSDILRGV